MKKELVFSEILSNSFKIGVKNLFPLLGVFILWILTIWIPYLNVGTTIALTTIPAELSKGRMINPLGIFDAKYRKNMGEYFLVQGLAGLIISAAFVFMVIPGIVMAFAYMFAPLLVIDKGMNPSKALSKSNKLTYGHKWTLFAAFFVMTLPLLIPLINIIYLFLIGPIYLSITGYVYGVLTQETELLSE